MDHPACGISITIDFKPLAMIRPPRRNFWVEKEVMSGTKGRTVAFNACGVMPLTDLDKTWHERSEFLRWQQEY